MAVHRVTERSAVCQLNVLLLIQDSQLKLSVLEAFHVDLEVAVLLGLEDKGMMVVPCPFSALLTGDLTGSLACRIHDGVGAVDMHLNGCVLFDRFAEVDVVAHADPVLELFVDGEELYGLELVDALAVGWVDVGRIHVGVAEVDHVLGVGSGLDGEGAVLLRRAGLLGKGELVGSLRNDVHEFSRVGFRVSFDLELHLLSFFQAHEYYLAQVHHIGITSCQAQLQ